MRKSTAMLDRIKEIRTDINLHASGLEPTTKYLGLGRNVLSEPVIPSLLPFRSLALKQRAMATVSTGMLDSLDPALLQSGSYRPCSFLWSRVNGPAEKKCMGGPGNELARRASLRMSFDVRLGLWIRVLLSCQRPRVVSFSVMLATHCSTRRCVYCQVVHVLTDESDPDPKVMGIHRERNTLPHTYLCFTLSLLYSGPLSPGARLQDGPAAQRGCRQG